MRPGAAHDGIMAGLTPRDVDGLTVLSFFLFPNAWQTHGCAPKAVHGLVPADAWILGMYGLPRLNAGYVNLHDDGAYPPCSRPRQCRIGFMAEKPVNMKPGRSGRTPVRRACLMGPVRPMRSGTGTTRLGLQCLCNLNRVPLTGAVPCAAPSKIENGSDSP